MRTSAFTPICTFVLFDIYIPTHTHTYAYTHTHTHTHTHTQNTYQRGGDSTFDRQGSGPERY
jgi:hypothetical protein